MTIFRDFTPERSFLDSKGGLRLSLEKDKLKNERNASDPSVTSFILSFAIPRPGQKSSQPQQECDRCVRHYGH